MKTPTASLYRLAAILLIASMLLNACNLPAGLGPKREPTRVREPLPAGLAEVYPPDGSQIALSQPLTFYFDQPMDRASVEAALNLQPPGTLTWEDEATLTFTPSQPYPPASEFSVYFGGSAAGANGLALSEPVSLTFRTADYLRPAQVLPMDDTGDVPATAAVVVIFNQPVVPLGADPASLPAGFSLQPGASGHGEWLNTSTCIFYPDPPLAGGTRYTLRLNPGLTSTAGSPLAPEAKNSTWSFTTALPRLVAVTPSTGEMLDIDPVFTLTFNQPMDAASVTGSLVLSGPGGIVSGKTSWNDDHTELTFDPLAQLERNQYYSLILGPDAAGRNGTRIDAESRFDYQTYSLLRVLSVENNYQRVVITLSAPVGDDQDLASLISVEPSAGKLNFWRDGPDMALTVYGDFRFDATYTVRIAPELVDRWGVPLGAAHSAQVYMPPAEPSLVVQNAYDSATIFTRTAGPVVLANATNIRTVNLGLSPITLEEYLSLNGPGGYTARQSFTPSGTQRATRTLAQQGSRLEQVSLALPASGGRLSSGLYYLTLDSPQVTNSYYDTINVLAVASDVNVTMKIGPQEVLVWAVDLRTGAALSDAPVQVFSGNGGWLGGGQTDSQGLWRGTVTETDEYYEQPQYAIVSQPGEPDFGLGNADWDDYINAYSFGYSGWARGTHINTYLYSDRPIYRPGQTVYYRGVMREAFDAAYSLPAVSMVQIEFEGWSGDALLTQSPAVSKYGTFHGEFQLPENLPPGYYSIHLDMEGEDAWLSIPVAAYRKPEFQMSVSMDPAESLQGADISAGLDARYYFDAPVGDLAVEWSLYSQGAYFSLPGYSTGVYTINDGWFRRYKPYEQLASGNERTDADGRLSVEVPELEPSENLREVSIEMTGEDESGQPVSGRASVLVHPASLYIGLRPDQWIGQSGTPAGFEVLTVDWERDPLASRSLRAEFQQVTWEEKDGVRTAVFTTLGTSDLVTGADGKARLSFTPDAAGIYMLDVAGGGAHSQVLLWVGGTNMAAWPRSSNQRIQLTADQETYRSGDTAQVFIPNPFSAPAIALVSVERGSILQTQIVQMNGAGATFRLELTDRHAPNVYVSATIVGPDNDFRQGILNLPVEPSAFTLNVALTATPERTGPGEPVTLDLLVTDENGRPVQGEFSIAVADLAALALADPNSEDILTAFYSIQPLEIRTSLSLLGGLNIFVGGRGGGGGEDAIVPRENFPDTAYWNAELVTGADGRGQATFTLPDSLTTWRVDVRGVTTDTRIGQSSLDVIATKDLLIRPVTPRFLVAGDHLELAAVVNNNTARELNASVSLQASGVTLDSPSQASQRVSVPANGRVRVSWWGTVESVESADLVFAVEAGDLQDASRPVWGALPVLRYAAPHTFVTAGMLSEPGSLTELLALPRSFDPASGGLQVEMTPALAGSLLASLDELREPPADASLDWMLSYLLPNLEVYRALKDAGLDDPALQARVETHLQNMLRVLAERQNEDGGWGWCTGCKSDHYITAYVLFGLARIREAGQPIDVESVGKAWEYLVQTRPYLGGAQLVPWQLDRLAFTEYVLGLHGGFEPRAIEVLTEQRDNLSPWAQALLALSLGQTPESSSLLTGLQTGAILTSSGTHWETIDRDYENPGTPLFTTAVVVFALAQRDPAAPALSSAVRYLASQRDAAGWWGSSYESAWVILALTEAMRGSGDLQAEFAFSAALNNSELAAGQAQAPQSLTPVLAEVPLEALDAEAPNKLVITRGEGSGRLYYRAALTVYQPIESVEPLDLGLSITREYLPHGCGEDCAPIPSVSLAQDDLFSARLTLTVPHDSYYVVVEDYIPAGSEVLNRQLKTSQQFVEDVEIERYDPDHPLSEGWGWWYFDSIRIYDDHIQWTAEYLPAGTYMLSYTLVPTTAGEYRVLPAHAWLAYFPEVQGTGAGQVFAIKP